MVRRGAIRNLSSEVRLDHDDGMPRDCVISLDNLRTMPKAVLVEEITVLSAQKMLEVCRTLNVATGCQG